MQRLITRLHPPLKNQGITMTLQLDKDTKTYVVTCDECPEHIETECTEFNDAREIAKKAGWRTFKGPDDKWANSCPACVSEFVRSKR